MLRLPARSIGLTEAALEVVYRVLWSQPQALEVMTGGDVAAANRFIDRWIALSATRDVGELFLAAAAAAGRTRRHCAAVALCALIVSDAAGPGMREEGRAAQALALGLRASREQAAFEADQRRLADLRPSDPDHQDQLLLKRVLLARGDPLRAVDATDAVRAAVGHVAGWEGPDALIASMGEVDPLFQESVKRILKGQLPESETDKAVEEMSLAQLS